MIRSLTACTAAATLLAFPAASRADRRFYGETYNAATAPRGALDVELWSTFHDSPRDGSEPHLWRHQLELETGITDRWDVAIYNVARQVDGKDLEYEALKLETRYRLSSPGQWFVDPVLYLEVKKEFVDERPLSVEEKIILGKDVGPLNLSLNLAAEQELEGGEVEPEWEWALGTSWEVAPVLRLGAEAFGTLANEKNASGSEELEALAWAGPAVSIAVRRTWLVLAGGFGLTDASERVRARAILAFQF